MIKEYKDLIKKTAVYPTEVKNFGIAYTFLGLVGECNELMLELEKFDEGSKDLIIKEAGDVCWYVMAMINELELDAEQIFNMPESLQTEVEPITLAECIKKYYRDNKTIDKELFTEVLSNVVISLKVVIDDVDSNIEEVIKLNTEKLLRRREQNTLHGDGSER